MKLKNELAALVDTSLWVTATQDVRSRERDMRARLVELGVESRLRREELSKCTTQHKESNHTLNIRQLELEEAQRRLSEAEKKVKSFSAVAAGPGGNIESISDMVTKLAEIQSSLSAFKLNELEPLQKSTMEAMTIRSSAGKSIDQLLSKKREEAAKVRSSKNSTATSVASLQKKVEQLQLQVTSGSKLIAKLTAAIASDPTQNQSIVADPDPVLLRQAHEQALSGLTGVNLRIDATNVSLVRLKELTNSTHNNKTATGLSSSSNCKDSKHSNNNLDACPTCGQEMPAETREQRKYELDELLSTLQLEKNSLVQHSMASRKRYDSAVALKAALEQQQGITERLNEMQVELDSTTVALTAHSTALNELEAQITAAQSDKEAQEAKVKSENEEQLKRLSAATAHAKALEVQEATTRQQIDAMRRLQEESTAAKGSANAKVALAQERVSSAYNTFLEREAAVNKLTKTRQTSDELVLELTNQALVLERLTSVLGTRGIQNHVFQGVIQQLESITNSYLTVLAEGGIQLALQSDAEDDERIVKSVWIRSTGLEDGTGSGEYRERNLSQLSGGQWRRVSLALDFAFSELIRRRGVLRCNLMVMDEVLTHLDASGREAVGTVLRAMVQGPRNATDSNASAAVNNNTDADVSSVEGAVEVDEFGVEVTAGAAGKNSREQRMEQLAGSLLGGGAYETVIVILQDLAAAELEEAFDHVDVVVKRSDSSVVMLDGSDDIIASDERN